MERPPPEITVRDPSRPARPADVLESGQDEPRPSPFTKRRLQVLAVVVLVLVAGLGVAEVRDRRAAAAEDRRLDRVLELAVEVASSVARYDPASGAADLEMQLGLRNDGPRQVVVERGTAGGYVLARGLVEVPPGEQVPLLLRRTVTCSPTSPPPPMPVRGLRLELRTAAGPRAVDLPLDPGLVTDEAAQVCGFVPLPDAVEVQLVGVARLATAVQLSLDLRSRSIRPVAFAGATALPGLRAEVTGTDTGSTVLPLRLPDFRDDTRGGVTVEVRVTVADCARARATAAEVELRFTRDSDEYAYVLGYDPAFLGTLLSSACPT